MEGQNKAPGKGNPMAVYINGVEVSGDNDDDHDGQNIIGNVIYGDVTQIKNK
jgi:hypothetical protein